MKLLLAIDGWAVTFGTARWDSQDWAGPQPAQAPTRCTKCNSPPINGQCNIIIIIKTMFMVLSSWQNHCESSPGSFDECRMAPIGRRPKTKPDDLGCESAGTGCQKLHPPSPFIITQPES